MFLPGMNGLDPSKIKPEVLAKMTELIRELPFDQIQRMQTLMHNSMAGFDVRQELEEFERNLPPGFREKMARLMYEAHGSVPTETVSSSSAPAQATSAPPTTTAEARLTILKGVAAGAMSPEDALQVLFPDDSSGAG